MIKTQKANFLKLNFIKMFGDNLDQNFLDLDKRKLIKL